MGPYRSSDGEQVGAQSIIDLIEASDPNDWDVSSHGGFPSYSHGVFGGLIYIVRRWRFWYSLGWSSGLIKEPYLYGNKMPLFGNDAKRVAAFFKRVGIARKVKLKSAKRRSKEIDRKMEKEKAAQVPKVRIKAMRELASNWEFHRDRMVAKPNKRGLRCP